MRFRRRNNEIFSLSFLDCICCGFGAVLLLFVLMTGKKAKAEKMQLTQIEEIVGSMDRDIAEKKRELGDKRQQLGTIRSQNLETEKIVDARKKNRTKLEEELALLLEQLTSAQESLEKLIAEKEAMPTVEEKPPIPIPNEQRRQYLTGFRLDGDNVLFLVEASGGMMDDTLEGVMDRLDATDDEKRKAPKWVRVKKGLTWMIANLKPTANYKIIFFSETLEHLQTEFGSDWFDPSDENTTKAVLDEFEKVVPQGGANLERAFGIADELVITPDSIVLMVDGLPTLADSFQSSGVTTDADRVQMFRAARRALAIDVPVSTILYPLKNDPGAAVYYWRLASSTSGGMVSPSNSWPDL